MTFVFGQVMDSEILKLRIENKPKKKFPKEEISRSSSLDAESNLESSSSNIENIENSENVPETKVQSVKGKKAKKRKKKKVASAAKATEEKSSENDNASAETSVGASSADEPKSPMPTPSTTPKSKKRKSPVLSSSSTPNAKKASLEKSSKRSTKKRKSPSLTPVSTPVAKNKTKENSLVDSTNTEKLVVNVVATDVPLSSHKAKVNLSELSESLKTKKVRDEITDRKPCAPLNLKNQTKPKINFSLETKVVETKDYKPGVENVPVNSTAISSESSQTKLANSKKTESFLSQNSASSASTAKTVNSFSSNLTLSEILSQDKNAPQKKKRRSLKLRKK